MADDVKRSYLDENLTDAEKESGRVRQPNAADEAERPYPGGKEENRADKRFERPDEFGDGDRRS
jgi:hypothetical protein